MNKFLFSLIIALSSYANAVSTEIIACDDAATNTLHVSISMDSSGKTQFEVKDDISSEQSRAEVKVAANSKTRFVINDPALQIDILKENGSEQFIESSVVARDNHQILLTCVIK